MPETELPTCSLCDQAIPNESPGGQCASCLFSFASEVEKTTTTDDLLLSPSQLRYFGDYELESEIARGGMGVVYRARQVSLNRPVAIKMILSGQLASPESVERFRLEAAAAARVDHPNIIPIFEVGEYQTQHYFSMKLVEGGRPISEWATGRKLREIIVAMEKVAHAISYAHSCGVLHRDLKPHNILMSMEDEPLITDFGLAKLLGETASSQTITGSILGSPGYMAPEQASHNAAITTSADVYGLGAVLYELLTGHLPFEGGNALSVLAKLRDERPQKPRNWNPELPHDLEKIALKCLEKKPADRYPSALALADDLLRFQRGEPVSARPLSKPAMVWRWVRNNPAIATFSLIALIIGGSGITRIIIEKNRTASANLKLAESIDRLEWGLVDAALDRGDRSRALAHLAATLRADPERWQATMFATSILSQSPFPLLSGPIIPETRYSTLSADGSLLAAVKLDNSVVVMRVKTGENILPPFLIEQDVRTLAFDLSGKNLAITADNGTTLVSISTTTEKPLFLPGKIQFSKSGKVIATLNGSLLKTSQWDGATLSSLNLERVPNHWKISPDASYAVFWTGQHFQTFDLSSRLKIADWEASQKTSFVDLSGDGSTIIIGDKSGRYEVFTPRTGTLLLSDEGHRHGMEHLALDQSGDRSYRFYHDGSLRIADTATGRRISTLASHRYAYSDSRFSSDRSRLLITDSQKQVRFWSLPDEKMLCEPINVKNGQPKVNLAADGRHFLIQKNKQSFVWEPSLTLKPETYKLPDKKFLHFCFLTPEGRWVVIANSLGTTIIDRSTGLPIHTFQNHGGPYAQLYDPVKKQLSTVTDLGKITCHQLETGELAWETKSYDTGMRCALITPDYQHIVTGADDGFVRVFNAHDGSLLRTADFGSTIRSLNIFPDGLTIIAGGKGEYAATYEISTLKEKLRITAHPADTMIVATAIAPDGASFATAAYDKTARIWDSTTGEAISPPLVHLGELSHLAFSPDGKHLATAARDGNARLWHRHDGSPASTWLPHPASATTVQFTSDGTCLVVNHLGGFRLWDAQTALPISVNFHTPTSTGLGVDSPMYREIISADGNTVQLGVHCDAVSLWDITRPPEQCPPWFPDFLEAIGRKKLQTNGTLTILSPDAQLKITEEILKKEGWHARWARQFLGR